MAYVYMKVLESAPARYDRGMRLLTLGRLEQVHHDIASRIHHGEDVLDLGCGTGSLAALLAQRGANVTAVDISPAMLDLAAGRLRAAGLEERVTLQERGVVELDTFPDARFQAITSTLVFSELSRDEIAYGLAECHRILRLEGRLLVADEILPESPLGRIATFLFRLPFAVLAFLLTQNTTQRVTGLRESLEAHGFQITAVQRYLAGTLQLLVAQKVQPSGPDAPSTGAGS
jgi:demethylmenaquinone methyltransferase/2-methoxy-6-polyprenyl-1,4-benzoquinol methylase